jgi:hypothetical protein
MPVCCVLTSLLDLLKDVQLVENVFEGNVVVEPVEERTRNLFGRLGIGHGKTESI